MTDLDGAILITALFYGAFALSFYMIVRLGVRHALADHERARHAKLVAAERRAQQVEQPPRT